MFESVKIDPGLAQTDTLYSMGDIVHNGEEMLRLEQLGMQSVSFETALNNKPKQVLFRAHGEPPASYQKMEAAGISVKDATCPIVLKLQKDIAKVYEATKDNGSQILIFGKRNHPEVISLLGHCNNKAIVIEHAEDLEHIDFDKTLYLFSQTTKYKSDYQLLRNNIVKKLEAKGKDPKTSLIFNKSSCGIVANRDKQLREFVKDRDLMIFVSGEKSSNGKQLFEIVSGATSTPLWLLEKVKTHIETLCNA